MILISTFISLEYFISAEVILPRNLDMMVASIGILSLRIVWHTQKYKTNTCDILKQTEPQIWASSDLLDLDQGFMDLPHFHSTACTFFSSSDME